MNTKKIVLQTGLKRGIYHGKKNIVLLVNQHRFKILVLLLMANSDSDVSCVVKHLFGNNLMSRGTMKNIGLNYGLKKISQSANYLSFQDTVSPNTKGSKIIGSNRIQLIPAIILRLSMLFMTVPTFTRMAV